MILRYFVLFPAFVGTVFHCEAAMELSLQHLTGAALLMLGVHLLLLHSKRRSLERSPDEGLSDDAEEFPKAAASEADCEGTFV